MKKRTQSWTKSVFIPTPKKSNPQKCSNYCTVAPISHASMMMLKILQARLQQYVNQELADIQTGFRKGSGIRDQIANIHWITEKAREFWKNIYLCFINYTKAFDCGSQQTIKFQKRFLTCLLRNLYADQEATVRTRHGTNKLSTEQ